MMTMDWRKFGGALAFLASTVGAAIGIAFMAASEILVLRVCGIGIIVLLFLFIVAGLSGALE